jgi:hypothetical protein
MAKVPAFAKAFAGRWRIVEMDTWDNPFLDLIKRRTSPSQEHRTARSSSVPFRAFWTCAMALATDRRVLSSHGRARTTTIPPVDEGGPAWEPPDASWDISRSTSATTQASSANAPDFFSNLLVLLRHERV